MPPPLILFILPDLGGGGAQKVMLSIAGGIDRSRFTPRILVLGGSQTFAAHVPGNVEIEHGGAGRLRDGLPWLVRRIRALEPDACVSVMGYVNLALLAFKPLLPRKTRLVIREANVLAATLNALPRLAPGRALYRTLYPRADAIVCPTREIRDELTALSPLMESRLRVIPNPVDVASLRAQAAAPLRHPGAGLRFVCVGRLTHQKGYDRLISLLPGLPGDTHVTIFGDGPDREKLEMQAQELAVSQKVTFAGFSLEAPDWIAGADALLLPSRWEGLPNVVLESLALGTPAIVSDQAAVGELARAAPPGAVEICKADQQFIQVLAKVIPSGTRAEPCPSLLPPDYALSNVIETWGKLLDLSTRTAIGPDLRMQS